MSTGFQSDQLVSQEEAMANMKNARELLRVVQEQGLEGVMALYNCDPLLASYIVTFMDSAHTDAERWAEERRKPEAVGATHAQAYASAYLAEQLAKATGVSDGERLGRICGAVTAYQVLASVEAGALPNPKPSGWGEAEIRRAENAYRRRFEGLTKDTPVEPPTFMRDGRMVRKVLEAQMAA